ncbi:amidotransferase 1, exosortase A system-associated [Parasalinivibrio latis]|uniref:XrtA/PEP-CTERM system amidotransferase n=1 Tax=Parasalinivibrio latis TaxID=2952610 RepID=UPI0030DEA2C2
MCGIAGILNLENRHPVDMVSLHRMNRIQAHRGPDDEGYFELPEIGLAHRRLSIIDLSGGHQPLLSEDSQIALVFNGEIYNYVELGRELSRLGYHIRTHSDTEILLLSWRAWGTECVKHFRGMFAFALWDNREKVFFAARDRLGKKPFYYAVTDKGQLVFGSELKTVMAHPDVSRSLRPEMVEEYLMYGYIPDPGTPYKHVFKLPPASRLLIQGNGSFTPEPYWDVPYHEQIFSDSDWVDGFMSHFREAVNLRMRSDVPVGAFLSGGVDSSAVVSQMAGLSEQPVRTCAIGFNEADFDESDYAAYIARRYETDHSLSVVSADDRGLIDCLIGVYDEPFADSSAMPTLRVCEMARSRVKVVLSGDGGDELFAGYRRHRLHMHEQRVRDYLPQSLRSGVFGPLGRIYPKADWAPRPLRAKTTFQALAKTAVDAYAHTMSKLRFEERWSLYSESYKKELAGYRAEEVMRGHAENAPSDDPVKFIQYLDMKTWLPGDILTKVDRASMHHSLEVRAPLLDHVLWEWGFSVPSKLNIQGRDGKWLMKKAMAPYLSEQILYRPKKGFSIPLAEWLRGPLAQTLRPELLDGKLAQKGWFDQVALCRLYEQHQSGTRDNSEALWSLLILARFIDAQG